MSDEIVPSPLSVVDLFAPASTPVFHGDNAGKGSEEFQSNDIIVPRISLLQGLSKPVVHKSHSGAVPGAYWLTPLNRPLNHPNGEDGLPKTAIFVISRISMSQRKWKKLDEGGGLECEAPGGTNLMARQPNGLTGAKLELERSKKGDVKAVSWEGGRSTASCHECCYGLAALNTALGRQTEVKDRTGSWLPKMITVDGEVVKLPDEHRAPKCTSGFDVLVYVLVPAYNGMPAEIMPAMMTLARSSFKAGIQIGSMLKLSPREPAWAKLFGAGTQVVTNDKGTFYVTTVSIVGASQPALQKMAEELYNSSKEQVYSAPFEDVEDVEESSASQTPTRNDDVAPNEDDKW